MPSLVERKQITSNVQTLGSSGIVEGMYLPLYESGKGYKSQGNKHRNIPEELRGVVKRVEVDFSNSDISKVLLSGSNSFTGGVKIFEQRTRTHPSYGTPRVDFEFNKSQSDHLLRFTYMTLKFNTGDPYNCNVTTHWDFERADLLKGVSFVSYDRNTKELKLRIEFLNEKNVEERYRYHYDGVYYLASYYTSTGAEIKAEGAGRVITFSNFQGDMDVSRGLKLELYRHVYDVLAHMQTVDRLTGLEDRSVEILSLEPNDVDVGIRNQNKISWVANNQERFKLVVNGKHTFTGGTESEVNIPANLFVKGVNTAVLEIYGLLGRAKKSVTFRGYGEPEAPIFSSQEIYNSSRPTITWASDEQHTFSIKCCGQAFL